MENAAGTMMSLSPASLTYLRQLAAVTPWSPTEAADLPDQVRAFEEMLFEATGQRGLPVLAGWVIGHVATMLAVRNKRIRRLHLVNGEVLLAHRPTAGSYPAWSVALTMDNGETKETRDRDLIEFVESKILLDRWSHPAYRLVDRQLKGDPLAAGLGILPVDLGRWARLWHAEGRLLIDNVGTDTHVSCNHSEDVIRCLQLAERGRYLVKFDETTIEVPAPRHSMTTAIAVDPIYDYTVGDAALNIAMDEGAHAFVQTREREGIVVDRREVRPGSILVTSIPDVSNASARLRRYFAEARFGRPPGHTSVEGLRRWLEENDALDWQAVLALEESLGGLISVPEWPGPADLFFGPWLMLELREKLTHASACTPGASHHLTKWPFIRFDEHDLFLVATNELMEWQIGADRAGRLYHWDNEQQLFSMIAETGIESLEDDARRFEERNR